MNQSNVNLEEAQQACKVNLDFFASCCAPDECEKPFSSFHHALFLLLTTAAMVANCFDKFVLGVPRGHAKTFLIKIWIVYLILFTPHKFILVVAATQALAEAIIDDAIGMLDSPNIITLFGSWRAEQVSTDNLKEKVFRFRGKQIVLKALGAGASVRGVNRKNARPDVIIMDDMQTKESAQDIEQGIALLKWMTGTLLKAGSPSGCLAVYIGNMYPDLQNDKGQFSCILRNLQKHSAWKSMITGAILLDGTALWEEVHPLNRLIQQLKEDVELGTPEEFFSELMNDPQCGQMTCSIDLSKIHTEEYKEEICEGKFLVIDLATDKPTADQIEIGCFSLQAGIPILIRSEFGKMNPTELIQKALIMAMEEQAYVIAVEGVAFQYTILHWFSVACEKLGISGIDLVELSPKGVRKNARIGLMLRKLVGTKDKGPELGVCAAAKSRLVMQIVQWNPKKLNNVDDLLDIMAYANQVVQDYGPLIKPPAMHAQGFALLPNGSDSYDSLCF